MGSLVLALTVGLLGALPPPGATPVPAKLDPKLFDRAVNDYDRHDVRSAAPKFYEFLKSAASTDENYAWAQYFLGKSLVELKLRHAAAVYFAKVPRERTNPEVLPRALKELQEMVEFPHDEMLIDEQIFQALDLGLLADGTADFAQYQQGMVDLRRGFNRWARGHFSKLTEGTSEASRARMAMVVNDIQESKEATPAMVQTFQALSADPKISPTIRNEAILAVARLQYERKEYEQAFSSYEKVQLPPLSPGRATLYLEEAWTQYQLGHLHESMGLLTTLDAPSFRDEFLPDKYLLRAFIFRDLCYYLPAKRAAKELTRRFADSLEAIRERSDLTQDPRMRRAAISRGTAKKSAHFLEALDSESERLGRYAGSFGPAFFTHLTKLYSLERGEASRVANQKLEEAVREEADKLLQAAEQVRLMDYEVGIKLYERIKKNSKLSDTLPEVPLSPTQASFRFGGEYWNDELRNYRFSLKSRCIEERNP